MILGSLPFALYVATLRGYRKALIKDEQVQGLIGLLLVTRHMMALWYGATTDLPWSDALCHVALNVTSVVTTRSVNELNLQVGTEVLALIKATEVSLAKV